jgi:hypothetical protein
MYGGTGSLVPLTVGKMTPLSELVQTGMCSGANQLPAAPGGVICTWVVVTDAHELPIEAGSGINSVLTARPLGGITTVGALADPHRPTFVAFTETVGPPAAKNEIFG